MSRYTVARGSLDPISLIVNITPSDAVPDLSLVTSVDLYVVDTGTGVASVWTAGVVSQSTTALQVKHPYATADTATLRTLRIYPRLTITGAANVVPSETSFHLVVIER